MSSVIWPGSIDSYFAMCDRENERERVERAARERAETDPAEQCSHGVSLYKGCDACGVESGEVSA